MVSSSARVTSVKFHKGAGRSDIETPGPIDRTPETPGSGKNIIKALDQSGLYTKYSEFLPKSAIENLKDSEF